MAEQLNLDEQAALMADQMLAKGGAGDMPTGRGGSSGAEGGFTPDAGGKPIDKSKQARVDENGMALGKGAYTGEKVTGEPGPQGQQNKTGDKITNEPKGEEAKSKAGANGSNLDDDDDDMARKRKEGKVGVSGGSTGGGLPEDQDQYGRARKEGKVGISKAAKADDEMMEEEDEEEAEEKASKSMDDEIDGDALIKSLETLEAIAQGATVPAPADRRAELAKGLEEGTLSTDEMRELGSLMKAGLGEETEELVKAEVEAEPEIEDLEKSYQDQFGEDNQLQEGYDVSPFLERHSQLTAAALDQVQGTLTKSLDSHVDRTQAFNTQLAKSLNGMAQLAGRQEKMIKSLQDRLETVENTPLPRKGVGNVRALQKSIDGEVGGSEGPTRQDILNALEQMAMKSDAAPCGEPLMPAVALFENSGQLTKSLHQDVVNYIRNGAVR
jgi:hypothetical protein